MVWWRPWMKGIPEGTPICCLSLRLWGRKDKNHYFLYMVVNLLCMQQISTLTCAISHSRVKLGKISLLKTLDCLLLFRLDNSGQTWMIWQYKAASPIKNTSLLKCLNSAPIWVQLQRSSMFTSPHKAGGTWRRTSSDNLTTRLRSCDSLDSLGCEIRSATALWTVLRNQLGATVILWALRPTGMFPTVQSYSVFFSQESPTASHGTKQIAKLQ